MNRRVSAIMSLVLCMELAGWSCAGPTQPGPIGLSRELTRDELRLVESSDRFGFKLFREVVRQEVDQNIFISPLSVSMALGMTANGAAGSTLDAMLATLELADISEEESNQAYRSLIELLTGADPQIQFHIANSIWYSQEWTFEADFYQRCRDYFQAEVRGLDFTDPAAVLIINDWIETQTNDKIRDMLDAIPADAVMYLINALYFKATWRYEFDPAETVDDEFTRQDGSTVAIRMMRQEADLLYYADDSYGRWSCPMETASSV